MTVFERSVLPPWRYDACRESSKIEEIPFPCFHLLAAYEMYSFHRTSGVGDTSESLNAAQGYFVYFLYIFYSLSPPSINEKYIRGEWKMK